MAYYRLFWGVWLLLIFFPQQITFLKYNEKSISWNAVFWKEMLPKKNLNCNYIWVNLKLLWEMILDLGKCPKTENSWKWISVFLIWALPEVQNWFQRQFFNEVLTILCFFVEHFVQKKWHLEIGISYCIWKMWFDQGRVTFWWRKKSRKAKHLKICISFGISMP